MTHSALRLITLLKLYNLYRCTGNLIQTQTVNSDSPEFTLDATLFTFSGLIACDSLLTFGNKMRSQEMIVDRDMVNGLN